MNEVGDNALVLIIGFMEGSNRLRLVQRDDALVADWPVKYSGLFPDVPHHNHRRFETLTDWHGSNILSVDTTDGDVRTLYGDAPGEEMLTYVSGKHERLYNGHLLITEFEAGRAFEVDGSGRIVWEYINRYDEDLVAEITEARAYPASYFTVMDWSCPQ